MIYDLIVVGAGPAGLTAGMYGGRAGLRTVVLERGMAGGAASTAPMIQNYPGFASITGAELVGHIREQALKYAELHELEETKEARLASGGVTVSTDDGRYTTKAIIIATGTEPHPLGVPGEDALRGRGVSYCALCDGPLFKGKGVVVVGGGNTAVAEAIYLQRIGCRVALIHRRKELRADHTMQADLVGVKVMLGSTITAILGDKKVEGVRIKRNGGERDLDVDGVFIAVGSSPNNDLARSLGVRLDADGYILTDHTQRTNVPCVYAAGDVTGGVKQIVAACSQGAVAALSAYEDVRRPYWSKR